MALQIANPTVISKIDRLARLTGLNKTAAVEKAVDRLLAEAAPAVTGSADRLRRLLAQIDRIPDRADAVDPLDWDEQGLPR